MATLDEIFDAMPAEAVGPTHEELTIDADSRQILVPEVEEVFGVESDTQAERKYFRCPRYVGANVDLAACFLRVNFRNANGEVDAYLVEDVAIDGDDITFSWELSRKVTTYQGQIQFSVCAIMGAGLPEWNTTTATGTVLEGLEPDSTTVEAETTDVVTQLRATVAAQTAAVEAVGAAQAAKVEEAANRATEAAKDAVEAKGAATLATIPEDYTALENTVDQLTRDRAAAIVCQAEGATIQVTDASNDPLQGLRIFGRSTQDGTPTPDTPVEIVNTPAPVVRVWGKNLLPRSYRDGTTKTHGGLTYTVREDGSVYVTGTVTAAESYFVFSDFNFGEKSVGMGKSNGVYFWTDCLYNVARNFTMLYFSQGNVVDRVYYPQVEMGTTATEYEAPAGQTLTVTTPDGLPGIPVAIGGNYTDANGQQWIADEVDLARGVYVQRVGRLMLDGSAKWNAYNYETTYYGFHIWDLLDEYHNRSAGMCNQFETVGGSSGDCVWVGASNANVYAISKEWYDRGLDAWKAHLNVYPLEVIYARITPIETPLTDVELQAFRALHSCKPTTTVMNDAGAHMILEYAADPKTYIDNKLAAIVAATT